MKKVLILVLAITLAACTAAPTQPPEAVLPEASQTPVVVVQTVVVEATQAPTDLPPPTVAPPVVVTVVVQPTTEAPTAAPAATTNTSAGPNALDNALGKGVFINMTMSNTDFSLRCLPRDITFNITTNLPDIVEAELFYRTVDQPKALYYKEWRSAGKMESDKNGNFSIVFSGEDVHPDYRLDLAWFEFQFVGLNKGGGVVDRSQKIEKLVTYRIDCP